MNAAAPARSAEVRDGEAPAGALRRTRPTQSLYVPAAAASRRSRSSPLAEWWPIAALVALPFIAAALSRDRFTSTMLAAAALQGVFVVSWDLLAGTAGQPSLGHALVYGGGAYAAAFVARGIGLPPAMLAAVGALAGGLVGGLQGRLTRRLTPAFVALVTLATVEGARQLSAMWTAPILRGISSAQMSIAIPAFPGGRAAAVVAPTVFGGAVVIAAAVARSRFGLALRAAVGEERDAASLGFDAPALRLAAFILAGTIGGAAGAYSAQLTGHVTPGFLSWRMTLFAPAAAILGGTGTVVGPAAAAYVIAVALQWFDVSPAVQLLAFTAIVVASGLRDPEHFLRSSLWSRRRSTQERRPP